MFKRRTLKNANKKKLEDIKDAVEGVELDLGKEDVESGEKKKCIDEETTVIDNKNEQKEKKEKKEKKKKTRCPSSDDEMEVLCKFFTKKKQKKLNKESLFFLRKYNKLISVKSDEHTNREAEEQTQSNVSKDDNIYKGEIVESKNYGEYSVDTDIKYDHRAILERNIKISEDIQKGKLKENVYRGKDAYEKAINIKKDNLSQSKYTGFYGPVRSSNTNVRMTLRVDYEPCICKDYKETGYCGFGDTCIFLHDRSDYKSGWKIEQEYEKKKKKEEELQQKKLEKSYERMIKRMEAKQKKIKSAAAAAESGNVSENENENENESESEQESESNSTKEDNSSDSCSSDNKNTVPFACLSCKKKWNLDMNPSVTECSHYFCETCFIKMFQESKKCAQCGMQLSGIMNTANNIVDLLNKRK